MGGLSNFYANTLNGKTCYAVILPHHFPKGCFHRTLFSLSWCMYSSTSLSLRIDQVHRSIIDDLNKRLHTLKSYLEEIVDDEELQVVQDRIFAVQSAIFEFVPAFKQNFSASNFHHISRISCFTNLLKLQFQCFSFCIGAESCASCHGNCHHLATGRWTSSMLFCKLTMIYGMR